MKRWYSGQGVPVQVECPERGWPNRDAEGRTQYDNTHWDHESDAWARSLSNARAGVNLSRSSVEQLQDRLEAATRRLTEDIEALANLEHARQQREEMGPMC